MALLGTLQVRLGIDTASFSKKFDQFGKGLTRSVGRFQKSMAGIGNLGTMLGGAGLVAGLADITRGAVAFDTQMRNVNTLLGLSEGAFAGFKTEVSTLAAEIGKPIEDATKSLYDAISAGVPQTNALDFLRDSSDAALAGIADLSTSGDALTTAVNAWGMGFENTREAAATLFVGVKQGKTTLGEIGGALSKIAPLAAELGVTLEEVAAGTASVTTGGGTTSEAMTQMRAALVALVKPTKTMEYLLESTGYATGRAAIDALGFRGALDLIKGAAKGSDAVLGKALGSVEALGGVLRITGAGGDVYNETMGLMTEKTKIFNDAVDNQKKGPGYNLARLMETINAFKRQVADGGFLNGLTSIAGRALDLLKGFEVIPQWMKNLGLAAAAAAAALPFLAFGLSTVAGMIPPLLFAARGLSLFMLGPWGIALAAAGAAVALFANRADGGFAGVGAALASFQNKNKHHIDNLKGAWSDLGDTVGRIFGNIGSTISEVTAGTGKSVEQSQIFANSWEEFFTGIVIWAGLAVDGVNSLITVLVDAWTEVFELGKVIGGDIMQDFDNLMGWMRSGLEVINDLWKQVNESVGALAKSLPRVTEAARIVSDAFSTLATKGKGYFSSLTGSVDKTTQSITNFGKVGMKETDRAVGNSWLTDLCEKGRAQFMALVTGGITPATEALQGFGRAGSFLDNFKLSFAPRAIEVDESTGRDLTQPAQDFESAWNISLYNVESAMDQLARNGSFSFKGMINSMIADLASAQLQKAVRSLWSGIAGSLGGGGGGGGGLGGILGGVVKAFASFNGGGYTGRGPRTGGMDGKGGRLAMLHPQETVIDHTQVRGSGGGGAGAVNLSVPITLMPGVSREELAKILPEVQKNIISIIPQLIARGGRYAGAFGQ